MLERGIAARYASPVFFRQDNDFDVYVEDTAPGYDKIFSVLLSRAVSTRISLSRVFPLGCREEVIAAARRDEQLATKNRRSVFIVDGDLYLLCGEREELPGNVVVMSRYCVENFLWDEEALVALMDDEDLEAEAEQLRERLDFAGWLARSIGGLRQLFLIFAVAHKFDSGIPTLSRGSRSICASHDGEIDVGKIEAIHAEIYGALVAKYGVVVVEYMCRLVEGRVDSTKCFVTTYVSGKDFILPFAIQKIRAVTKSKASNINLKVRLAKMCDVSPLASSVEKIALVLDCADIAP